MSASTEALALRRTSLGPLRFAACRVSLRAATHIEFLRGEEGYKGGALHDRFEFALSRVSRADHALLCDSPDGLQKPYTLLPPLDTWLDYPPGAEFCCMLTLIGDAIDCFPACREAFRLAGATDVGTMRGRFDVIRIESISPTEASRPISSEETAGKYTVRAETAMHRVRLDDASVTLLFRTPVRLQGASRQIPDFYGFFRSQFKRLERLCARDSEFPGLDEPQLSDLLRQARVVRIVEHQLKWYDWPRLSPARNEWMRLGGHLGRISYRGEIASFLPYLALGEWLHIGAHGSFGLGNYTILGAPSTRIDRFSPRGDRSIE